jgi:hypothetical protein
MWAILSPAGVDIDAYLAFIEGAGVLVQRQRWIVESHSDPVKSGFFSERVQRYGLKKRLCSAAS